MQSSFVFLMIRPGKMQGRCRSICADVFDFVHLRADFKNRHFTRKRELGFTGRFEKMAICP
jgi:hypothetical protein